MTDLNQPNNNQDNDERLTNDVFEPVLERFKNILAIPTNKNIPQADAKLQQQAIREFHHQLKGNGIINFNIIPQFQSKLASPDEESALARSYGNTASVSPEKIRKDLQKKIDESISPVTSMCPNDSGKIEIVYGIEHFKFLNTNTSNTSELSKKVIPLGPLKGQLFEQISVPDPNIGYRTNKLQPDLKNPIPFEIDKNGKATLPCIKGKNYYIKIDTVTSDDEIQQWLDGYQFIINDLAKFLEEEWKNVHLPRWKANRDVGNNFWQGMVDGALGETGKAYATRIATKTSEHLKNPIDFMVPGYVYGSVMGEILIEDIQRLIQNIGTPSTKEQEKQYSFYLQDKIHMYILQCLTVYWQELFCPADKAYLKGKKLAEILTAIAGFILEIYLGGKAIDLVVKYASKFAYTIKNTFFEEDLIKLANSTAKLVLPEKMVNGLAARFAVWSLKREININARIFNKINTNYLGPIIFYPKSAVNYVLRKDVRANLIKEIIENIENQSVKNLAKTKKGNAPESTTNLDPVSMLTGEELLTLIDDTFFSHFPFVWQRLYRTSAVEFNSGLGYGWSHSLCHSLTFTEDNQVIWQNHENNLTTFPLPTQSVPAITNLLSEAAIYLGHEPNHYVVSSKSGIYHFQRDSADDTTARLIAISDKYGHQHQVIYDNEHKLMGLTLAGGDRRIILSYSADVPSQITQVNEFIRSADKQSWQLLRPIMRYEYNTQNELITATNALNQTEQYEYDASHLIIQRQMAGGAVFNWQWQGTGKDAVCDRQITNLNGIESRYEWEAKSGKSVVYQSDGTTLSYIHNEQGKLISETNAAGQTTTYDYNDNGQLIRQTDPQGGETQYLYNEYHKLSAVVTPDGQLTEYYWWGEQISQVRQGKRKWQYRYNEYGDRTEEISPEGKKTGYQYNEHGQCTAVIFPDDTKRTQNWDAFGRCIETVNPDGRSERYAYDSQGRICAITNEQNQTVSYLYDALGQIICITYPDKTTREYQYNAYGKVTRFKDETGKITEYEYASPLHLMTEKRLPNGEKLKFRYDNIHLQVSEIENQKGEVYHLRYTPTGQLSEEVGFDGIKTTYHYNNAGHLTEKREYGNMPDEKPLITQYQRDATGRLIRRLFADGVTEQYEYDEYGQLIKVKDGDNVLVWEYNLDGQLTAEHQNWATIRHRYDNHSGQLIATKLPDGQLLEYHHRHGQLRGITLDGESIAGIFYDGSGRECERRQGNGLINRYRYNELGQLASHQVYRGFDITLNDAPVPVWQQQYQYEADGQLAEIRGNQPRRYRYDKVGQLQTVSYPDSGREQHHAEKTELFNYDQTGNKINEKQPLSTQAFAANIAKGNRLIFFSYKHFEYDRFGNLITEKRGKNQSLVTHYEYDCRHRLIKVIKPTGMIITYTYDPFNRRTSKTVNGKTTEFIWQGSKLIAETDNDKHWQSYIYEPDSFRPLALIKGNAQQGKIQRYWYQNDQLGTPIRLTDSIGETLYQCEYNAYGRIIDETHYHEDINTLPDNPLRFQGQYYDEETGLHYNYNRYYDPFIGRYITQDPLGILGGINTYQYCQNPINWIDPLGLFNINQNGFEALTGKETGTRGNIIDGASDAGSASKIKIEYTPEGAYINQTSHVSGGSNLCGPTCCTMIIIDKRGNIVNLDSVVKQFDNIRPSGVNIHEMSKVLFKNGVPNNPVTTITANQLKDLIIKNQSAIIGVSARNQGHFIIVDSYKKVDGVGYYMIRDPYNGAMGVKADLLYLKMNGNGVILK